MGYIYNSEEKLVLGRLGWSLRRIQKSTGVRRETVAACLREAGVTVRAPGRWGREPASTDAGPPPAKPATEATTDSGVELAPAGSAETTGADPVKAEPAIALTT